MLVLSISIFAIDSPFFFYLSLSPKSYLMNTMPFRSYVIFAYINNVARRVSHYLNTNLVNIIRTMYTFSSKYFRLLTLTLPVSWLMVYLILSGDIHPIPGPYSESFSPETPSFMSSSIATIDPTRHLSFIHYNVQSIIHKIDILKVELGMFDILGFSETWLNSSIPTNELLFENFATPERKDRRGDSHGGLLLYVRDSIHYVRRKDLEPQGIECIWIEVVSNHKHILFGLYYRPPNANRFYDALLEDSFSLAFDSGNRDIVFTVLAVRGVFCLAAVYAQESELKDHHGSWTLDTCDCGSNVRQRTSFKACKLVSLKETTTVSLEIVKDLKRELEERHNRPFETDEISSTHSEVELLHTGYQKLQQLTLDLLVLEIFQDDLYLNYPLCDLVRNLRRMLCHIRPVLSAGTFTEPLATPSCTIARQIVQQPDFTEVLNFAENVAHNATSDLSWMVSSINVILNEL